MLNYDSAASFFLLRAATAVAVTVFLTGAGPAKPAKDVDRVLGRMDESSATFKGLTARLVRVNYTRVINDKSEETGNLTVLRTSPRNLRILVHYERPDVKDWALSGNKFEIFYPKLNTVQEYDVGRRVDDLLLLGFGTSGKDLAKKFNVTYVGQEQVAGQDTAKLKLVPKSKQALEYVASVDLWYFEQGGYPLQQKFYQPTGDYNLVTYSNIKVNPPLKEGDIELKLPGGVKRERPQQ